MNEKIGNSSESFTESSANLNGWEELAELGKKSQPEPETLSESERDWRNDKNYPSYWWRNTEVKIGTPEYRRLAFDSINQRAKGRLRASFEVYDALVDAGFEATGPSPDDILDLIGNEKMWEKRELTSREDSNYAASNDLFYYDMFIDPNTDKLVMGRKAEEIRQKNYNKEIGGGRVLPSEISNFLYDSCDKIRRVSSEDKELLDAVNLLELKVNRNNSNGYYAHFARIEQYKDDTPYTLNEETETIPFREGVEYDFQFISCGQTDFGHYHTQKEGSKEEIAEGERILDGRITYDRVSLAARALMHEINFYGCPIEQDERYQAAMKRLVKSNPQMVSYLEEAMDLAIHIAPDDRESWQFVQKLQSKIREGIFT